MYAAVVNDLKKPPVYRTFLDPQPLAGEVLIRVRAAGLHPIVKALAGGAHYSSNSELPMVPGLDGVGVLDDGSRVYFAVARKPWGSMCEYTVALRERCLPLPDGVNDVQAAAIANPGMSAWLSLKERATLAPGETVLVLGATGVAGHLAIQAARYLGAKRIIAAGRNVDTLANENIDTIVTLNQSDDAVRDAFAAETAKGIDVVIDYLWGRPTELLLEAFAKGFNPNGTRLTRLIEVGSSAGATIALPGATLRSVNLKLMGSGFGSVPLDGVFRCNSPLIFDGSPGSAPSGCGAGSFS